MKTDEATATAWVDGVVESLYESFKDGKGVTLPGFGGFYVRPEPESWVSKFNPGQRLRALFGWPSTCSGKLQTRLHDKEEWDAKGNQSVGNVPT
jgi:hypothetical protein